MSGVRLIGTIEIEGGPFMNWGNRKSWSLIAACLLAGCSAAASKKAAAPAGIDDRMIVDLTYSFDEKTIYWPTAKPFVWEKESWGQNASGYWYTAARYSASEHGGTHMDAPIHFAEHGQALDQIPVGHLVGPAEVIDVSAAAALNPDYLLSPKDITDWEARHGRLPDHSILLMRSGWGKYWGDKKKYLGTDTPGDTAHLHFPGISPQAAELLARQRHVDAVGLDTPSLDHGPSKEFMTHRILLGANIYGLENVANLDKLPATGATLIALPMKIKGGTGGPTRIIAILP
jgi:kynurenine formamidase